jgi:hypothetical protein
MENQQLDTQSLTDAVGIPTFANNPDIEIVYTSEITEENNYQIKTKPLQIQLPDDAAKHCFTGTFEERCSKIANWLFKNNIKFSVNDTIIFLPEHDAIVTFLGLDKNHNCLWYENYQGLIYDGIEPDFNPDKGVWEDCASYLSLHSHQSRYTN